MSAAPPITRRVLDALRSDATGTDLPPRDPTPVTRAYVRVEAALDEHTAALATLDRIEEGVVIIHGYPRVPLPDTGTLPAYAADAATIARRLGYGSAARRLSAELRRRQAIFKQATRAAGLDAAWKCEALTAQPLSEAAANLLLAPSQAHGDLTLKLAVLIAAGEATADDAFAYPWLYLRRLHTELSAMASS